MKFWRSPQGLQVVAALLLLALMGLLGATPGQLLAMAGIACAVVVADAPRGVRFAAAAAALSAALVATRSALPDDETARLLGALALVGAGGRAVDAAFPTPRTGFWAGVVGAAFGTGALALLVAAAHSPGIDLRSLAAAIGLLAFGLVVARAALSGPARASVGAWVAAGLGLAAVVGALAGSAWLPRLGVAGEPVPVLAVAVMLAAGRALHELALQRRRAAAIYGTAVAGVGLLNTMAVALAPGLPASTDPGTPSTWLMPPMVGLATVVLALLMAASAIRASGRFQWTMGWLCGLLLVVAGSISVPGLLFDPAWQAAPFGTPLSPMGAVGLVALGFGAMQVASAEMRSARQRAVWLPAMAAMALVAVTLFAWQQASRQEAALRNETAALGLERALREIRMSVAARAEGLAFVASALRQAAPSARTEVLQREGRLFGRDHPGMVEVILVGPDRRVVAAQVIERAEQVEPGINAAFDAARRDAYRDAESRNRVVFLGPLDVSRDRGPGYLLVVPVDLDGQRHFVASSGRFAPIADAAVDSLPDGAEVEIFAGGRPVVRRLAAPGSTLSAQSLSAETDVLRTTWGIAMRSVVKDGDDPPPLSRMILAAGIMLALLVAIALRLAAVARERELAATGAARAQLAAQQALAASRAEAARVLDSMVEAVLSLDRDLRVTFANARAGMLLASTRGALYGRTLGELLPRGIGGLDPGALEALCRASIADGASREASGYAADIAIWLAGRVQPGADGATVVLQDVSAARRAEVFEREQREVLRDIARGAPLEQVLVRVCTLYDDLHPGSICSAVLYDRERRVLHGGVAPGLPADYLAAIEGLPVGPTTGSCGTAMWRRERVLVTDIVHDPLWADYREIAARFGLAACWSQPFLSRLGEPLGSLAVYHREAREPLASELAELETLSALCALAVERDQSLRQLAESEQCFRSLFDLQPDAVFAFDLDGTVVAANEAVAALSGYPLQVILGKPYDTLIEPSERERVRGFFEGAVAGGVQRYSTIGVRADGEPRIVDVTNLPIMVDGRIVGIYGVTRDVTEQRAAEARLIETDRFFALSPAVFAISDGNGRYSQVNDAFPRLLGVTRDELLARPVSDFVHPDDLEETRDRIRTLGRGETLVGFVNRQLAHDGSFRWLEWNVLRTEQDTLFATARDVTAERLSQQSEALMRRVIEGSPAVLWRWREARGRPVDFVTENVRAWGYEKSDFEQGALTYEDIILPTDREAAAASAGRGGGAIYRIRRRDGGIAWVDERTAVVLDGRGGVRYRQGITLDVTAVMQAREQEDRLLRAIGEGPAVLWRFNPYRHPATVMVTGNVRRWGYEPADFTSGRLRFDDLVHPDDRQAVVVDDLARIEAREDQFSREFRLRTADGRWVWINEHLQAVRDADGNLEFGLALSVDVTEQRQAREEERQLRQVIELSPAVLWRFNFDATVPTRLASANVRAWGYEAEDFTSGRLRFADLIHPSDRERVYRAAQAAIHEGTRELQLEYRFRTADGRWLWLDERMTILRGPRGEPGDCVSLILDVTAQREALEALHERDQFYALSLDMFVVAGTDARIRQVNEALVRVLGFQPAEFIGRNVLDFVHPDDVPEMRRQIGALAAGRRVDMAEFRCRHAEGGWRWLEWNAAAGIGGLFYCAGRDITASKAVAAELHRALRDLELRNAELQDFAFVASHDLQEPLRKVQAFSDRVLQRYAQQLDPQAVDYLRRMDAAAARMQTLIDDLLAYSRVSTRGGSFRSIDLGRVLDEVVADLEARLESSGGEIVRGALPELEADPTQMRQLLQNLLGNALKFAVPGRRPRVEVRAEAIDLPSIGQRRPGWRIVVADNGIGFEPGHAERIFAPFQRLHGRSEYEGTGMGLAIVRKIVERHGGTVAAHGVPGEGATFTVDLPAGQRGAGAVGGTTVSDKPVALVSGGA